MPGPFGGVNDPASARTLTRSTLPGIRIALLNLSVEGLGEPAVLTLTSATSKLTKEGA
jgi:hypothetical protein